MNVEPRFFLVFLDIQIYTRTDDLITIANSTSDPHPAAPYALTREVLQGMKDCHLQHLTVSTNCPFRPQPVMPGPTLCSSLMPRAPSCSTTRTTGGPCWTQFITNGFPISLVNTRHGLVRFSSTANVEFDLDDFTTGGQVRPQCTCLYRFKQLAIYSHHGNFISIYSLTNADQ